MSMPVVWASATDSAAATQALAAALATCLKAGQVLALRGDLGAGKTTFVQGLAHGLGIRDQVSSPTFVLINEYTTSAGMRLVHMDTYRLGAHAEDEAGALGLDELLDDPQAVVAIEWAERVAALLPDNYLLVEMQHGAGGDQRLLRLTAYGPQSAAALHALQRLLPDSLPA